MKKTLSVFLLIILCALILSSCKNNEHSSSGTSTDSQQTEFASVVTVVQTPQLSYTPEPIATLAPTAAPVAPGQQHSLYSQQSTPAPIYTPIPTTSAVSTPIPTTYIVSQVSITKSPISETVSAGGTAVFTAYADNSTSVNWIIASADRKTIYALSDAPNHFPGLSVSGAYTNVITLTNIPASMNGWEVQAYFEGPGGPKYTANAYITVTGLTPGTNGVTPGSIPEMLILQQVDACVKAVKSYSQFGYTVSDMANYKYTPDAATGGTSTFNVTFSNTKYTIVAEFIAKTDGYYPVSAAVFDPSWAVVQAYSFINNATLGDFVVNVLDKYH